MSQLSSQCIMTAVNSITFHQRRHNVDLQGRTLGHCILKWRCCEFVNLSSGKAVLTKAKIAILLTQSLKGTQKGNVACYARQRVNRNQPFRTAIIFLMSLVYE